MYHNKHNNNRNNRKEYTNKEQKKDRNDDNDNYESCFSDGDRWFIENIRNNKMNQPQLFHYYGIMGSSD